MTKRIMPLGLATAALVLLPALVGAQQAGQYAVSVLAGQTTYEDVAAIQSAPMAGIEAQYQPTSMLGVGFYVMGSRPTTDERYFPMSRLEFKDSVYHYLVNQQVVNIDFGVSASLRAGFGAFEVMGLGGAGRYVFALDEERSRSPQSIPNQDDDTFSGMEYMVGGSVGYNFGESGVIRLQVRDMIYTDYDRNRFDVSEPLLSARNVPHPNPDLLAAESKDTVHSIRLNLGFTFFPGGR